jgi:CheY-like chemotaxis protein
MAPEQARCAGVSARAHAERGRSVRTDGEHQIMTAGDPSSGDMAATDPGAAGGRQALVVDDAPMVGRLLAAMLGRLGWTCEQFTEPAAALEAIRTGGFHLVLADHGMPGMTGTELAGRIAASETPVPVVIVTGRDLGPDEAGAPGVLAVVRKPFQLADLRRITALVERGD